MVYSPNSKAVSIKITRFSLIGTSGGGVSIWSRCGGLGAAISANAEKQKDYGVKGLV